MTPLAIHNEFVLVVAAGSQHSGTAECYQHEVSCINVQKRAMQMCQPEQAVMAHPGGRCTTTANTPGLVSPDAMGTVSTHRVKEPHKWTCKIAVSGTHDTKHVKQTVKDSLLLGPQTAT